MKPCLCSNLFRLRFGDVGIFASIGALVALANLFAGAAISAETRFPLLWQKDLQTFLESAATVSDLAGDGHDKGVVAGREELFAVDGNGKILWHWKTKGRFMTYPAVLSRIGQPSLIYAADNAGLFTCLAGNGQLIWQAKLNSGSSWSASVVCNLAPRSGPEVIQTDDSGMVSVFSAVSGKLLWQKKLKGAPVSPAVGDLDGDGKLEIVVATGEGVVSALGGGGQILWERKVGGPSQSWATCAPVLFGGADGRGYVAVASSDGMFFCLDSKGDVLWSRPLRGAAASTISVGDLDLDGRADICLVTQLGVIYRFDETGRNIWEIDMQGRSLAPGAMIDLDGDGKLEYVLCTQNGLMLALNNEGEFIHKFQFNNRTINVTPAFGNLLSNSPRLQMLVTGGESGVLFEFDTMAQTNALVHWKAYRGDSRNSGSWFGLRQNTVAQMTPANLAADKVLAGENLQFTIQNPEKLQGLAATAACIRPDGSRQTATTTIFGKQGNLLMPLEALASGPYHFEWTLTGEHGRKLVSGERTLYLQPFVNERSLFSRTINLLNSAADACQPELPLSSAAMRREMESLDFEAQAVAKLQNAIPGNGTPAVQAALDKTVSLVARAKRAMRMGEVIQKAVRLGRETSLLAFEGTTWENRKVDEQLPVNALNPLRIERTAVPGEHEPVALDLFNVTDHELLVRILIEPLTNGVVVTPHHSVGVPTSLGEISWDPLPELDDSGTLTIPSLQTREVWLDIDLSAATAGSQRITLRAQALNGAGVLEGPSAPHTVPAPETRIEVLLDIPSFTMAPPGDFRLCTWAPADPALLPDLLAHGNNVFTIGLPGLKFDAQNKLVAEDFSSMDVVLKRLGGNDVIVLLQGVPQFRNATSGVAYRDDLKKFLDDLVSHMQAAGFDTNHFALYPFDEPGGIGWDLVNRLVEFGKQVHAINPGIMIYVDGGGELPMFEAMASCIDIWCPSIYMLAEKTPLMEVVRHHGKMLWSYNCGYGYSRPVGPNLKNMNLIGDYRAAGPFAFRHGATGIGFWCYNLGGDPWNRVDMEYMLVYPGRAKPVTSRRWEAVREGIEDYRILAALKKKLALNSGLSEFAATRIRHLLDITLPGMIDPSLEEMTRGLGRSAIDASNNDETIGAFRREMLDCVKALNRVGGG